MYISSKVLSSAITSFLVMLITVLITHAGLHMTSTDTALVTGFSTVIAGAVAGWYKKETDPAALQNTKSLEARVEALERKSA